MICGPKCPFINHTKFTFLPEKISFMALDGTRNKYAKKIYGPECHGKYNLEKFFKKIFLKILLPSKSLTIFLKNIFCGSISSPQNLH